MRLSIEENKAWVVAMFLFACTNNKKSLIFLPLPDLTLGCTKRLRLHPLIILSHSDKNGVTKTTRRSAGNLFIYWILHIVFPDPQGLSITLIKNSTPPLKISAILHTGTILLEPLYQTALSPIFNKKI